MTYNTTDEPFGSPVSWEMPPPPPRCPKRELPSPPADSDKDEEAWGQPPPRRKPRIIEVIDLTLDEEEEKMDIKPPAAVLPPAIKDTHVIFTIDFSGSMKTQDVTAADGTSMSRWDAVFTCLQDFVNEQLEELKKETSCIKKNVVISVVIFNEKAHTLLRRLPLVGEGHKVHEALQTTRSMYKPSCGTFFAVGIREAQSLALTKENTVLVFLSDGRPADLQGTPSRKALKAISHHYRHHGRSYKRVHLHLEEMQASLTLNLHFICLYKEGRPWLELLANQYKGTFHMPNLALGAKTHVKVAPRTSIRSDSEYGDDDSAFEKENSDGILDVQVKSQDTLVREKFERAEAKGNVISLTQTSMRSTFQSISSSVTATRTGASIRRQERAVILSDHSAMVSYRATRMVFDKENDKMVLPKDEIPNERRVLLSLRPFAQGGLRNVYRMKEIGTSQQRVAKESRHEIGYNDRLKFHLESTKCQMQAMWYTGKFNGSLSKMGDVTWRNSSDGQIYLIRNQRIQVLHAAVYRLSDVSFPGGYRYLAVESKITGSYEKWNNNNGYVNPSNGFFCQLAQTFSHFTYEKNKEKEMVVDIQGTGVVYTDPQLHSVESKYGRADRGRSGFSAFFGTHKCNAICRALKLKDRSPTAITIQREDSFLMPPPRQPSGKGCKAAAGLSSHPETRRHVSSDARDKDRKSPTKRYKSHGTGTNLHLSVAICCLLPLCLPVVSAWSSLSFHQRITALYSKTKDERAESSTALVDKDVEVGRSLWEVNASGSFGSMLMKMDRRSAEMQEQNRSYIFEDDALEIDPVKGNSSATSESPQEDMLQASDITAEEMTDDSDLLLTALDWEAAKQIDESIVRIKQNISELTDVREIPLNNPLGLARDARAGGKPDDISSAALSRRSEMYKKRMVRDQKLLVQQIASSINSVGEWKTVCELTDGVYPLLELIIQGGTETSTEQEKDHACRSARTLRDLCALSPEVSAVVTDGILRTNVGCEGELFQALRQLLEDPQEKQSPKGRHLRPASKKKQKTLQLYVAQLLLAISLASDDAVHVIRETEGLKEAVLACSSFATKERRRRWLRYPKEIIRWAWRSRRKGVTNLRRPFVEAGSISFDLNGQVQRTANQVLAAIGQNQWIPKIPGQRGLRILCLDGGGSRGMVAVTAVAALVEAVGQGLEVCDSFDMLAGTSTGAIISFLVGLRQETSSEAMERYNQLIKQIFVKSSFSGPLMLFTTATYDESPFMNILCNILGDDSMLDSRADPAVPLVFAVTSKMSSTPTHVALLRNYNYATGEFPDSFTVKPEEARVELGIPLDLEHALVRNSRYKGAPQWNSASPGVRVTDASRHPGSFRVLQRYALRASTAAPTVFKPVMMGGEMYCDGGIVASNPAAVAIHEARTLFPDVPIEMVVSIGTGAFIEQKSAPRIGWDGIIGQIVDSATDGEQVHHVLEDILGESSMLGRRSSVSQTRYFRFNPVIGLPDEFPIDVTDPDKLSQLREITREYMRQPEQRRKIQEIADILKGQRWWKRFMRS